MKDASLKASPSLRGTVIGTALYSKANKSRSERNADKVTLQKMDEAFEQEVKALKDLLVEKLIATINGKTSQGVKDYMGVDVIPKGSKFTQKQLQQIDFSEIQLGKWTTDSHRNELIRDIIKNYLRKVKELDAQVKRNKFNLTIGDELPSGIM